MKKHQYILVASVGIVALVVGFLGAYFYNALNTTVYNVELVNGCTKQPDGEVINSAIAGSALNVRVTNKDASKFASFALDHGICVSKN